MHQINFLGVFLHFFAFLCRSFEGSALCTPPLWTPRVWAGLFALLKSTPEGIRLVVAQMGETFFCCEALSPSVLTKRFKLFHCCSYGYFLWRVALPLPQVNAIQRQKNCSSCASPPKLRVTCVSPHHPNHRVNWGSTVGATLCLDRHQQQVILCFARAQLRKKVCHHLSPCRVLFFWSSKALTNIPVFDCLFCRTSVSPRRIVFPSVHSFLCTGVRWMHCASS